MDKKKSQEQASGAGFELDDDVLDGVAGGAMPKPTRNNDNEDSCAQNPKPWLRPPVR